MAQLSFKFQNDNQSNYPEDYFVDLPENSAAKKFLENFFSQKNFSTSSFQSAIIKGGGHSGKSYLLHIFSKKNAAQFIKEDEILGYNFLPNHFYIFEDIEKIKDEELLFHLINSAFSAKSFLLLSSANKVNFKLKDLVSRFKNIIAVEIKNPSVEAIEMLLINEFSRRQLKVSAAIVDFVKDNIKREYDAVFSVVDAIEVFCQDGLKKLTVSNVKDLIGNER